MNVEHIKDVIAHSYGEITAYGKQLFKVTRKHNNRPLGVYFFDCTNHLAKTDFDLDAYQESLLTQEFYQQRASLQWNIYLYFLCEESAYSDLLESGRISEIESNREYARKYVITEDRLETELVPQKEPAAEGKKGVPTDVSVQWIERLRKRDLDGAFIKDAKYTQVVERYLEGNPLKEEIENTEDTSSTALTTLSFIKRLELKHYRPYPTEPVSQFGESNLIRGVNGSGKTSLLEAIELWICGKTYRNPDEGTSLTRIGVQFIGNGDLEWNDIRNNALFRERDLRWYGNYYPIGNRLHLGFNRLNFYDSDAATRISEFADEDEVKDAISSIMLGPEVNVIEERLDALLKRFRQEQSSAKKDIEHAQATIQEARQEIQELGPTPEKEGGIYKRFIEELRALNWRGQMLEDNEALLNEFLQELDHAAVTVNALRRALDWSSSWSVATITGEEKKLRELLEKLEHISQTIDHHQNVVSELTKAIRERAANLAELERLKPYVVEENSPKLVGLEKAILEKDRMEARVARVIDALGRMDIEEYRHIDDNLGAHEAKVTQQSAMLQGKISKLEAQAHEIRSRQSLIEALTAEIRSKGRELLAEKGDIKTCPLCGAAYKIGELTKRIDEVTTEVGESEPLKNVLDGLRALESQLKGAQAESEKLGKLRYGISLQLDISDPSEMKLRDVVSSLDAAGEQVSSLRRESEELETLKDRLAARGLTEEDYRGIIEWYVETYRQPMPDYSRRAEFEKLLTNEESLLQEQKRILQKAQKELDTDRSKAQFLIKEHSGLSPEGLDDVSGVRKRYERLRDARQKCETTLNKIVASDDETFSDLSLRLSEIRATYERFSAARKQLQESAHIRAKNETKIREAQSSIDKLRPGKKRADIAVATIEDILQHDSKEKHVQGFLEDNLQEIARVFRIMHAPREFSELEFDSRTGALQIVRRAGQTKSGVTKISSGQRAALSLSIFLVLNEKLSNGPPLIILDDPVAHVDDLNILSFFDYLRELVIGGNRQLFFATASEKVANLYQKKFDFLGDEFYDISLTRSLRC